jgi:hypothetical protein
VEVLVGALEWLVELLEVAALAIAAPPPATAAVTASVVSNGLIRWDMVHLLGVACPWTMTRVRLKFVGAR